MPGDRVFEFGARGLDAPTKQEKNEERDGRREFLARASAPALCGRLGAAGGFRELGAGGRVSRTASSRSSRNSGSAIRSRGPPQRSGSASAKRVLLDTLACALGPVVPDTAAMARRLCPARGRRPRSYRLSAHHPSKAPFSSTGVLVRSLRPQRYLYRHRPLHPRERGPADGACPRTAAEAVAISSSRKWSRLRSEHAHQRRHLLRGEGSHSLCAAYASLMRGRCGPSRRRPLPTPSGYRPLAATRPL